MILLITQLSLEHLPDNLLHLSASEPVHHPTYVERPRDASVRGNLLHGRRSTSIAKAAMSLLFMSGGHRTGNPLPPSLHASHTSAAKCLTRCSRSRLAAAHPQDAFSFQHRFTRTSFRSQAQSCTGPHRPSSGTCGARALCPSRRRNASSIDRTASTLRPLQMRARTGHDRSSSFGRKRETWVAGPRANTSIAQEGTSKQTNL